MNQKIIEKQLWKLEELKQVYKDFGKDAPFVDLKEAKSLLEKSMLLIEKDVVERIRKIVNTEPAALIPRTKDHLEAYRKVIETRRQFRKEIIDNLNSCTS